MTPRGTEAAARPSPAEAGSSDSPTGRRRRRVANTAFDILGVVPGVVLIGGVTAYSATLLIVLSFQDASTFDVYGGQWVGFETVTATLTSAATQNALRNSIVWIVGSVFFVMALAIPLANYLRLETLPVRVSRAFMLIPWVLPGVVVAAIWRWAFSSQAGFINDALLRTGMIDQGRAWLGDPSTAIYAVMAVMVWRLFALVSLVLGAAMQTIDSEVEEAAAVDGASSIQAFTRIRIPMIKPHIYTMTLLSAIWVANNLVFVHAMTGGGPANSSLILPIHILRLGFSSFDMSSAAFVSVINVVVLLCFAAVYFRVTGFLRRDA